MHFTLEQLGYLDSLLSAVAYAMTAIAVPFLLSALF